MNKDLEEQLDEMGPEYRAVVARLRTAREAAQDFRCPVFFLRSKVLRPVLAAASLLILIGLGVTFLGRQDFRRETEDMSFAPREYRASVAEMIATQNPDGSWKNDFLTQRNAATLKGITAPAAQIAYKKAARYLSFKGLLPAKS